MKHWLPIELSVRVEYDFSTTADDFDDSKDKEMLKNGEWSPYGITVLENGNQTHKSLWGVVVPTNPANVDDFDDTDTIPDGDLAREAKELIQEYIDEIVEDAR